MTPMLGIMASQISGHLSPIPLTNLKLWLDASVASSITSSGGRVSQWNDQSAQGNNFVQATAAYKPETAVATINGLNALRFNNASNSEKIGSNGAASVWAFMSNATGCTIFTVGKITTANTEWIMGTYDGSGGVAGAIHYIEGTSTRTAFYCGGTPTIAVSNLSTSGSAGTTNPYSYTSVNDPANGTAANRSKMYLNSNSAVQNNTATTSTVSGNPQTTLILGNVGVANSPYTGTIGEVIVYSGVLSGTDVSTVQAYLKTKWGTP